MNFPEIHFHAKKKRKKRKQSPSNFTLLGGKWILLCWWAMKGALPKQGHWALELFLEICGLFFYCYGSGELSFPPITNHLWECGGTVGTSRTEYLMCYPAGISDCKRMHPLFPTKGAVMPIQFNCWWSHGIWLRLVLLATIYNCIVGYEERRKTCEGWPLWGPGTGLWLRLACS